MFLKIAIAVNGIYGCVILGQIRTRLPQNEIVLEK